MSSYIPEYFTNIYKINSYNMITDNIAIGDHKSDYSDFDIIVNLNFPDNMMEEREIKKTIKNNKIIYTAGMHDSTDEDLAYFLDGILPDLIKEGKDKKILFHCYAGISRSTSFAIAYIGKTYRLKYDDIYPTVKAKRSIIQPNSGFVKALKNYL